MENIKIAWAEDNAQLQKLYVDAVALYPDLQLVATARSGDELIMRLNRLPADQHPQVVVMDVEMPGMNGIEATRRISALLPDAKVLMFTVFEDANHLFQAITAGASGYLLKDEPMPQIVQAIKDAAKGEVRLSPLIASTLLQTVRNQWKPDQAGAPSDKTPISAYELTPREIEILGMIVDGLTYTQIADKIFISPSTVRKHIENIYAKLHVNSKAQAIQLSYRNEWFGTPGA
ncbi:MAG: response regulator transcription factor [Bacteroidetes bacterium]|nr:response regulator transcription factor [Bacteroidota bacterium]